MANPFDVFEDPNVQSPGIEPETGLPIAVPTPTLAERFDANRRASYYTGTILGAVRGAGVDRADRENALRIYEDMPQWETPLEGIAALAGQLAPQVVAPENYVPIGLGPKVMGIAGVKSASWGARFFAGAIDAGASNLIIDSAIQGIEIKAGTRESFDPQQLALSTGLGAVVGGGAGAMFGRRADLPAGEPAGDRIEVTEGPDGEPEITIVKGNQEQAPPPPPIAKEDPRADDAPKIAPDAPQAEPAPPPIPKEDPRADDAPRLDGNGPPAPETGGAGVAEPKDGQATPQEPPPLGEELDRVARERRNLPPRPPAPEPKAEPAPKAEQQPAPEPKAAAGDEIGTVDLTDGRTPRGDPRIALFDPRQLKVDAKRFQFKSDGDAEGVNSALKGITRWRKERGNQIIVWQALDGSLYVVDGHQRTGLARRLLADGLEQKIEIPGVLLREADGVSDAGATLIAALKNIAEGSASPIDAAKVLRMAGPSALKDMPLSRDAVRIAADLARLSDEPWGMVVNGVVEPRYARFVAKFIPDDPARQAAAMKALAKADPANEDEAAILVRRVQEAGLAEKADEQGDMFGGGGAESTALEEVRIVAAAVRALRSDKALLARVARDAGRIEEAGSKIDRDAARAASGEADVLSLMVEKLAFYAGPVRDILKASAIEVKNGRKTLADARAELVAAIRREKSRADAPGNEPRGDAGTGDAGSDGGTGDLLGARFEKGADGKPQAVIPGAEKLSDREMAQRLADQPLKPKVGQKLTIEHGLFGDSKDQGELFFPGRPRVPGEVERSLSGRPGLREEAGARVVETAQALADALEATARMGRLVGRTSAGQFSPRTGVIRVKRADDFRVMAHELGHHTEEYFGKPLKALMDRHRSELEPMRLSAYANAAPPLALKEGFAEYMAAFVTNPAYAARQAPAFDRAFRAFMAANDPDHLKALDDAAAAWADWLTRPSTAAVGSTVVSTAEPKYFAQARKDLRRFGLANTIADYLHRAYAGLFDDLHPLNRAVRGLAAIARENGAKVSDLVANDAYKLARMSRGAWNRGHMWIMHGVEDGQGGRTAPLRDAIIMATGQPNVLSRWNDGLARDFGAYLWSRRALGEWDRFAQGRIPNPPDKLPRGDHAQAVKDFEAAHPEWKAAAAMVHDWAKALWTRKYEAGLITQKQWQEGLAIRDYVPGLRVFDQPGEGAGLPGRSDTAKGGFVRRFKGSTRDVVNPLESLVTDAYETAMAIARNDVVKALDRMARQAGPGGGAIAERIPAREVKATMIDPVAALEQAAREAGMTEADYVTVRDAIEGHFGADRMAIFRPALINEKGEPIAFFRDGGELRALRLADGQFGRDMYRALTMMTERESNVFLDLLAKPAAVLRAGITAAPEFILANFIRDQATSWIFYGGAGRNLKGFGQGVIDDALGREALREYASAGGILGGGNMSALGDLKVRRDLSALAGKGWKAQRLLSAEGLLRATEFSETATRVGLFRRFKDEALARGLSPQEALLEAAWRARDHIDFNRRGSAMAAASRLIPFLNASLQGLDKTARHMIVPLFREAVTPEDHRARGMAMKAWARLAAATVATMGLHALMVEQEGYDDISAETKGSHWMIKAGEKWVAVPKPFELGAVLNLGPAAWDMMKRRDPRWAETYMEGLYEIALPPNVMQGNPTIATAYELATGVNLRSGAPIVDESLQGLEPWLQYTHRTSELGKLLGRAFGASPAEIDHMITAHTGSLGRSVLSLYDYALSDKPAQGWDDFAFTRRFIKDASRGASSSKAFWALIGSRRGELESARRSWQTMMDNGDISGADDYLASRDGLTRDWIAAGSMKAEARRLHPLERAGDAVRAISDLRRDMGDETVRGAKGDVRVPAIDRGAADDILAELAMAEARNSLVVARVPGWEGRDIIPVDTYHRELAALSPDLARALADRFASRKVVPFDTVQRLWPDFAARLREDGSEARVSDLVGRAKAAGFELDGDPLKKRKRSKVPGQ